eukprot:NP_001022819.1 Uncharacterized protein CELE_Y111B2A.27 [Caenorhabditis elegans]
MEHQELEQEAIGPALPPPSIAQKSELFEEHNVEYELVIRCAHKHGYLVRNMDLNSFHYDAASRHLFMADISSLVKNTSGDDGAPIASYAGCLDYAPCSDDGLVGARQDLESWFYQLVHLVLGELPWGSLSREEARVKKAEFQKRKEFAELPEVFHKIAEVVFAEEYSVVEDEYVKLAGLTEQIYKELGGVMNHEENMDFEREPTPDEIPRFVMCRDDEIPTIAEEEEPVEVEEENSE